MIALSIDKRVRKNNVQRIIETVFRPSIPWKNHSCYGRVFYMLVCDHGVGGNWGFGEEVNVTPRYRTTGAPAPANPRHFLGAGAPAPAPAFFLKNRGLAGECLFAHNSKSFELIKKN